MNRFDVVPSGYYKCSMDNKMTIKEIRSLTGLSQDDFGKRYKIPLSTIKKWESNPLNKNYRECPIYVNELLKKAVSNDFSVKISD